MLWLQPRTTKECVVKISADITQSLRLQGYYDVRVFTKNWTWYSAWMAPHYAKPTETQAVAAWREATNSGRHGSKNWERKPRV